MVNKIVIASQKGGVGKTTLALNLGLEAIRRNIPAKLLDLDQQSTLTHMSNMRHKHHNERLPLAKSMSDDAATIIVDTPPAASVAVASALRHADIIIMPTRPSAIDIKAMIDTRNMAVEVNHRPKLIAVLLLPQGALSAEVAEAKNLLAGKAEAVFCVHSRIAVQRAGAQGLAIFEEDDTNICAVEYSAIADSCF